MCKTLLDSQKSVLGTFGETSIFETFRNPAAGGDARACATAEQIRPHREQDSGPKCALAPQTWA